MIYRSHLSKRKIQQLIVCFVFDGDEYNRNSTATMTAKILKLNRKTVNRYYLLFRTLILKHYTIRHDSQEYKNFEKNRLKKFFGIGKNLQFHKAESQWRFGKDRVILKKELLSIIDIHL